MTEQSLSPREFAALVGVSKQTAITWCAAGRLRALRRTDGTWAIPEQEAARTIASKRTTDLAMDRVNAARELGYSMRERRCVSLGERLAASAERFVVLYAALSAEHHKDVKVLRSLANSLSHSVEAVKGLDVFDTFLDELNDEEPKDDEWTTDEDFADDIAKDRALRSERDAKQSGDA